MIQDLIMGSYGASSNAIIEAQTWLSNQNITNPFESTLMPLFDEFIKDTEEDNMSKFLEYLSEYGK